MTESKTTPFLADEITSLLEDNGYHLMSIKRKTKRLKFAGFKAEIRKDRSLVWAFGSGDTPSTAVYDAVANGEKRR